MTSQTDPLDDGEIREVVAQLSAVYAKSQDDCDQSIRAIAAGAIAVAASLVALLGVGWSGGFAVAAEADVSVGLGSQERMFP